MKTYLKIFPDLIPINYSKEEERKTSSSTLFTFNIRFIRKSYLYWYINSYKYIFNRHIDNPFKWFY